MAERCENCSYRIKCRVASASRVDKVPLKEVCVRLSLEKFSVVDERALTKSEFQLYHLAVLRRVGPSLNDVEVAAVVENSNQLGVEPGQLILAALLAHRSGGADRPFYGRMLVGQNATRHLITYRDECATRYGTFDTGLLGDIANLPRNHNVITRLTASEELATSWAVRKHLSLKHDVMDDHAAPDVDSLYEMRELALDPWWLATEPSYHRWASRERDWEENAHELKRHRQRVAMATQRAGIMAVITARNQIAKDVVLREATRRGLSHNDVLVTPVFSEPLKLWRAVAQAAATSEALSIIGYGA